MTARRFVVSAVGVVLAALLGSHFVIMARAQVARELAGPCLPLGPVVREGAAPAFSARDRQGREVSLASFKGKVVLLNFWLSSCKPCEAEMPGMEQLRRQLASRGVELVAVAADESWEDVDALLGKLFPDGAPGMVVLLDPEKQVATRYGTKLFPETYLIDREGQLRYYFNNARDWGSRAARECVQSLL